MKRTCFAFHFDIVKIKSQPIQRNDGCFSMVMIHIIPLQAS